MRLTNKHGIPEAIVKAVERDPYTKGDADYSVTELLKPPRIRALQELHKDKLTEDVSDRIWSLFGQAIHHILERAEGKAITERRLSMVVDGVRISGAMDYYDEESGTLRDYKVTSVWKIKNGMDKEWEEQQNIYLELLRQNGIQPKKAEIVAILRDWRKSSALKSSWMPKVQVVVLPVSMWNSDTVLGVIKQKINGFKMASGAMPMCSSEDRWANMKSYGARCEGDWCGVAKFCSQYQSKKD